MSIANQALYGTLIYQCSIVYYAGARCDESVRFLWLLVDRGPVVDSWLNIAMLTKQRISSEDLSLSSSLCKPGSTLSL